MRAAGATDSTRHRDIREGREGGGETGMQTTTRGHPRERPVGIAPDNADRTPILALEGIAELEGIVLRVPLAEGVVLHASGVDVPRLE